MVQSVEESITFFKSIDFKLIATLPENASSLNWAMFQFGQTYLMIQQSESMKAQYPHLGLVQIGGSFSLFFEVPEIQSYYRSLSDTHQIIKPIYKTPYGTTEFALLDLNGYLFTFSNTLF